MFPLFLMMLRVGEFKPAMEVRCGQGLRTGLRLEHDSLGPFNPRRTNWKAAVLPDNAAAPVGFDQVTLPVLCQLTRPVSQVATKCHTSKVPLNCAAMASTTISDFPDLSTIGTIDVR